MVTGTIKLGAYKKLSRNPLPGGQLESFFYGGGVVAPGKAVATLKLQAFTTIRSKPCMKSLDCQSVASRVGNPARQHLIFYDNPSRKRDCKCTNILQKGALLTVRGEGQRLRKGFQRQWCWEVAQIHLTGNGVCNSAQSYLGKQNYPDEVAHTIFHFLPCPESLSSAAEIRHLAKNTRLRGKSFALLVLID